MYVVYFLFLSKWARTQLCEHFPALIHHQSIGPQQRSHQICPVRRFTVFRFHFTINTWTFLRKSTLNGFIWFMHEVISYCYELTHTLTHTRTRTHTTLWRAMTLDFGGKWLTENLTFHSLLFSIDEQMILKTATLETQQFMMQVYWWGDDDDDEKTNRSANTCCYTNTLILTQIIIMCWNKENLYRTTPQAFLLPSLATPNKLCINTQQWIKSILTRTSHIAHAHMRTMAPFQMIQYVSMHEFDSLAHMPNCHDLCIICFIAVSLGLIGLFAISIHR